MVCVSEVTSTNAATSSRQFTSAQSLKTVRPQPESSVNRRSDPYSYSGTGGSQVSFRPPRMPSSTTTGASQVPFRPPRMPSTTTTGGCQVSFRPPRMPLSTTTDGFCMPSSALPSTVSADVDQRSSDAVAAGLAYLRGSAEQPVQSFGLYIFSRLSN